MELDREDGRELAGADNAQGSRMRRDRDQQVVPDVQELRIAKHMRRGESETEAEVAGAAFVDGDRAIFPIFRKRAATARAGLDVEGSRKRTATSRAGEKRDRKRTATKRAGKGGAQKNAREEGREGRGAPAAPREERDRTDKGSETPRHDPG